MTETQKTLPPTRRYAKIRVSHAPHGAQIVTLFNPERRNAIGPRMINELLYAIDDAHAHPGGGVRSIVVPGEGKAFCAGGDFAQMTGSGDDGPELPFKGDYVDLVLAMTRSEIPIIAKVNGHAMGGGIGLVAACTFAIASADAKLGTPEVDVGLFPMMIMAVLSRVVPRRRLLEMMILGERMTAEEARAAGIVNTVVPAAELDRATGALCARIEKKSPAALALGLRAYADQADMDLAAALPMLRDRLAACLATEDAREGLMAFLEKRDPVWKGK